MSAQSIMLLTKTKDTASYIQKANYEYFKMTFKNAFAKQKLRKCLKFPLSLLLKFNDILNINVWLISEKITKTAIQLFR
ncbi:hypothetical protein COMNV_00818 [Commensalibacter sp. Nvir]|nr:hypothetical protein COMNV_00818 [Commensalibacter sp. Nvir]